MATNLERNLAYPSSQPSQITRPPPPAAPPTWLWLLSRLQVSLSCSLSLARRFCSSCSCCFSSCRRRMAFCSSRRSCCTSSTRWTRPNGSTKGGKRGRGRGEHRDVRVALWTVTCGLVICGKLWLVLIGVRIVLFDTHARKMHTHVH